MNIVNGGNRSEVRKRISEDATLSPAYLTMNALSTVIACYGLLADSSAVVIGSMLIAQLLGPITGIALALVDADRVLLWRAVLTEATGVITVLLVSIVIGAVHRDIPLGKEVLSRTSPNILDLVIALAAGAAGTYAMVCRRVSGSLVGVAIATALVPPLAASGLCLARGYGSLAFGGFLLFFANFVAIQVASSAVIWIQGLHEILRFAERDRRQIAFHVIPSVLVLLGLASSLFVNFRQSIANRRLAIDVREHVARGLKSRPGAYLADIRVDRHAEQVTAVAVVRTPFSIGPKDVRAMEAGLRRKYPQLSLRVRSVLTKESSSQGWIHTREPGQREFPESPTLN